jgi:hypothetical protein
MLYQLILITNLGMTTPLATFTDRMECIKEQGMVQKTAQASALCVPVQTPQQIQQQMEQHMKMLMDFAKRMETVK